MKEITMAVLGELQITMPKRIIFTAKGGQEDPNINFEINLGEDDLGEYDFFESPPGDEPTGRYGDATGEDYREDRRQYPDPNAPFVL